MKYLTIVLLSSLASGLAFADPPETFRPDRYKDLYLKSAITDPPPPIVPDDIPSDLPDWTLVGIGKTREGAPEVRIMNMKDRSRITIPSQGATDAGFSIVKVENSRNYLKDAVVTLKKGGAEGDVVFDTKFLVLKRVAAPSGAGTPNRGGSNAKPNTRGQKPGVPTPPGTRKAGTPPTPGAIPQPTTTPNRATPTTTSSTKTKSKAKTTTSSKRTRYVPRPKK